MVQQKADAENKLYDDQKEPGDNAARVAMLEAENARLTAQLVDSAIAGVGAKLGRMVDPGTVMVVQFVKPYAFGGKPTPAGKGSYHAAPFTARSGDVVRIPESIGRRLIDLGIASEKIVDQKVSTRVLDKRSGEFRDSAHQISASDLKKSAPEVGFPSFR